MPIAGDCKPDDVKNGGLCYTLPNPASDWEVTSPGFIGKTCNAVYKNDPVWDKNKYSDTATKNYSYRNDGTSCWVDIDTFGRGTGRAADCPAGMYKSGALCYTNCPSGYNGVAGVCWAQCPAGTTDYGVGCTKSSYTRNAYPWKFGDGLNNDGMLARCRAANPSGCSMSGAIAYPDCRTGYYNGGAGICYASCNGNTTDAGLTCLKKTTVPAPVGGKIPDACNSTEDPSILGVCYPSCGPLAKSKELAFWDNYKPSTVNICQRGPISKSKGVQSLIGQLPYPSCYYPTSKTAGSSLSISELQDININNKLTGKTNIGCLPNITGTQAGSAYDRAINVDKFSFPQNDEFKFEMGETCPLCATCYGSECEGSVMKGVRPTVSRVKYNADPLDCCNTGSKLSSDSKYTCDPSYRSDNPNRISNCYNAISNGRVNTALNNMNMDSICNDTTRFSTNKFCKDRYVQLPVVKKDLSTWSAWNTCDKTCGGGNQTQTRTCNSTVAPNLLQAVRMTSITNTNIPAGTSKFTGISNLEDPSYYIVQDTCKNRDLDNKQECGVEDCYIKNLENDPMWQGGALFIILVFFIILYKILTMPTGAEKTGGLFSTFDDVY